MTMPGVPVGGLKTVGQLDATNPLVFSAGQNGLEVAVALCSTHTAGAPVVDVNGNYLGFINEFDVMNMRDKGRDLSKLLAEHIMQEGSAGDHPFDDDSRRGEDDESTWGRGPAG